MGVKAKILSALSVESQVNELISEARNEQNLALIFHGWQAWM